MTRAGGMYEELHLGRTICGSSRSLRSVRESVNPTPDKPAGPDREGAGSATGERAVGPGGRYGLGELLGRGGMADVYRAYDKVLGRDVAVKLLRDRTADPSERNRFVAEAKTLARLNHPNLVTILDAGVSDDHPYLVLEVVIGSNLSVALRHADATMAPERVASMGAQVAAALAHCHAAGVVHRDVKPGNILLGAGERVLLTDFGISRLLDGSTHHTKTGSTIGTASYLAPEQVYGAEVTPAVDMYALGLVLLEACTGRREYTGTPVEAAVARLHRSPRIPVDLPSALASTLSALTQADPAMRPTAVDTFHSLKVGMASVWDAGPASFSASADNPHEIATAANELGAASADGKRWDLSAHTAASGSVATSKSRRRRWAPPLAIAGCATAAVITLMLIVPSLWPTSPKPSAAARSGSTAAPTRASSPQATPAGKLAPSSVAPSGAPRSGSSNTRRHVNHQKSAHVLAHTKIKKATRPVGGPKKGHGHKPKGK